VFLKSKEKETTIIEINVSCLGFYDEKISDWTLEKGALFHLCRKCIKQYFRKNKNINKINGYYILVKAITNPSYS
jgi:hypothetical protein